MQVRSLSFAIMLILAASPVAIAQDAEPPSRVGRIAAVSGTVSYHLAGAEQWDPAAVNLPLTDGAAIWTQPASTATLGVAGNGITLAETTEWTLDRLDDQALRATQPQGESYWRLRSVPAGDAYAVQTPRGIVALAVVGRYEIVSGDTEHPTTVTVIEGSARITGIGPDVVVGPNQTLSITGDGGAAPFAPTLATAIRDPFLLRMLAAERAPARRVAAPPAVMLMTGSEALETTGDWRDDPDYGPVWYPPTPTYIPYRNGRWSYVEPWGWTWIDAAPWGFAPSHYGRWARFGGRWGWIPGREWEAARRPVYAPALVGFLAGVAVGSRIGWAPLGPREEYRPPYRASPRALEAYNRPTGAVAGPITIVNRQAVTVVPTVVMTSSASVAPAASRAPVVGGAPQIRYRPDLQPGPATVGVTRAELRRLAPAGIAPPQRATAPGPALAAPGLAPPPAANQALPPLRPRPAPPARPDLLTAPRPIPPPAPLPRPEFRPETRPEPPRPPAAPRMEQPRIPNRIEAPRPEAPRPEAPRPEAPRPEMTRPEMTRPEPRRPEPQRPEPPRMQMPPPRPEPPRMPPPQMQQPRPQPPPAPRAEPQRPPPREEHRRPEERRP